METRLSSSTAMNIFRPGSSFARALRGDPTTRDQCVPDAYPAESPLTWATGSRNCATGTNANCCRCKSIGCGGGIRPGLLCIGDAAHAMSPAGGVGINLAIQDAIATANLLTNPIREGQITESLLAAVQGTDGSPDQSDTTPSGQRAQSATAPVFSNSGPAKAPWQLKAVA